MTKDIDRTSPDFQREVADMVRREVIYCVSSLVSDLASGYGETLPGELGQLAEEAFEMSTPLQDYESAAYDEGWRYVEIDGVGTIKKPGTADDEDDSAEYDSWEDCCDAERIEPHDREVYEHWIVSRWLANRLSEHGEKVGEVAGLTVWARTTTGQSIGMDNVTENIYIISQKSE